MGYRVAILAGFLAVALTSCGSSADLNGDGQVDRAERAKEMQAEAFMPMSPGEWETRFTFSDMDVPSLSAANKRKLMDEVAKGSVSRSCLSADEARNPGADFFGGAGAEKCAYHKFDIAGQNASMRLSCTMEGIGTVDMDLKGVVGNEDFNFDADVAMRLPMVGKIKLKGQATGRHVGACTQSS